jgi:hypothetical protein
MIDHAKTSAMATKICSELLFAGITVAELKSLGVKIRLYAESLERARDHQF